MRCFSAWPMPTTHIKARTWILTSSCAPLQVVWSSSLAGSRRRSRTFISTPCWRTTPSWTNGRRWATCHGMCETACCLRPESRRAVSVSSWRAEETTGPQALWVEKLRRRLLRTSSPTPREMCRWSGRKCDTPAQIQIYNKIIPIKSCLLPEMLPMYTYLDANPGETVN